MIIFLITQILSCLVWIYDEYQIYSYIILSFSFLTISVTIFETRKNFSHLKKMVDYDAKVNVFRGLDRSVSIQGDALQTLYSYKVEVLSSDLIPGDLVQIQDNQIIPSDLILLNGK